ncbi:MAG TPA: hypothetical protein VLF39_04290 [Candidatus Saccharimonadales bacterium]|nr:hypothetical protein [Candidatus Saccharimonadales bacterium]
MSNNDLEERETSGDDFSKNLDAKYSKAERKKLEEKSQKEAESPTTEQLAKDRQESAKSAGQDDGNSIPFRQEKKSRFKGKGKGGSRSLAKKALIGGGIGGGIVALIITIFVSLLPLKLIHIFENLQQHFFGTSESAVQNRSERLLSDYLKKKVAPGMTIGGPCGRWSTIDKNCVKNSPTDSASGRLYNAWRDARIENDLSSKFGIELAKTGPTQFKLSINGTDSGVNVDGWLNSTNDKTTLWTAIGGRSDVRQTFRQAFQNETYLKRIMYRFKVGRLLERKYGIKRCVFACNAKDKFDDWGDNSSQAFKLMVIRRVIIPHTQFVGFALECIITNTCGNNTTTDVTQDGEDNQRRDTLEKKIAAMLQKNAVEYSADSVSKIATVAEQILKYDKAGGFTNYLIQSIADSVSSDLVSGATEKAIPIIGYIDMAAKVWSTVANAGPKIKRWTFAITTTAMITYYMMGASQASEIKAGHTNHQVTGSLVSALGNTAGSAGHQNQPAENAPLYTALIGGNGPPQRSIISTMLPSALAADPANPDLSPKAYTCDDGSILNTAKSLVCPEESVKASNIFVKISDLFHSPPLSGITTFFNIWNKSIGTILGWVGKIGALGWNVVDNILNGIVPGYKSAKDAILAQVGKLLEAVAQWLIPSPISDNMSGARSFDMLAGGADAAGSDYSHYGLGAKRVTDQVAARIEQEQEDQALQDFQSRPFFARMFDVQDAHSLVSQLAMDVPISTNTIVQNGLASFISNPFTKIFNGFAAMLPGGQKVHAAPINDPFGIPQFAYDLNDPEVQAAMGVDPDTLTDSVCAQMNKDWANGTGQFAGTLKIDPDTGSDYHTKVDPCLLNSAAAGSAGGYFSTDVLSASDLGPPSSNNGNNNPPPTGGGTGGYHNPFHDMTNVLQSRIDEGVDYVAKSGTSVPVYAIGNGVVDIVSSNSTFYTTSAGNADWVTYHLTDGPAAGKYIYIAEGCPISTISPGDKITWQTRLCDMEPDSIEMGWASGGTIQTPAASNVYIECHQTAYGVNFNQLLVKLGAPTGHPDTGGGACLNIEGSLPGGWPSW